MKKSDLKKLIREEIYKLQEKALTKGTNYRENSLSREQIIQNLGEENIKQILQDFIENETTLNSSYSSMYIDSFYRQWKIGKEPRIDGTLVSDILIPYL